MYVFILNNRVIRTDMPFDTTMLDFLRSRQHITSVKAGCRTGSCGSCLILVGESDGESVCYRPLNSCILPLEEANGKHVLTVEGLNNNRLNPIQQAMAEQGAVQCGYCTPGIVISLTCFLLRSPFFDESLAEIALDGNLCRCTGYHGIKRAAALLCQNFSPSSEPDSMERIKWLTEKEILPSYLLQIPRQLQEIQPELQRRPNQISQNSVIIAGGTVHGKKSEDLSSEQVVFLSERKDLSGIRIEHNRCQIGAVTAVEEIRNSAVMNRFFPKISEYYAKIATTPIRYRATIGGNIVNASPIGDLCVFFLALDTSVVLSNGQNQRIIPLKDFFKAYKKVDKQDNELVERIAFPLPGHNAFFNFERICKHNDADIPSVNSAIQIKTDNRRILDVRISAGGVAPVPLYLAETGNYFIGKEINNAVIRKAGEIALSEISPVSDIRGSADYKRLLLRQLIYAHFVTLFPESIDTETLL